jgi:hypothetical protein
MDSVAIEAARLLGADRPWRRATDNDLYAEGEYRLRAAAEYLAHEVMNPAMREFHTAALVGIQAEIQHRLTRRSMRAIRGHGMTSADIQRIRDAVPCQEFLQPITDMKPAGRVRWAGACPFHADRTPSLSVHPTYFHCFGCGIGGDVFELARLVLGLRGHEATFRDAVRVLADFAGLPDPTVPPARYRVEVEP